MANLVVDIGNTALKAAYADGMTLGKTFRYQGEMYVDFILSLAERQRPEIIIVSTARELSEKERMLLGKGCSRLIVIDPAHTETVSGYGLPGYLSPDRAAGIAAVRYLFKGRPCTVFDFGTTLTIDFVDRSGRYAGGNISPGCRTRFKSLNRYSRKLPLVDTPDVIEDEGTSLVSSIGSGVIKGMMFEVEGYLGQHPENIVVFTGGDAIYFAKRMKNSIFVVCNLVLIGLALIADENDKRIS